MRLKGVAFPKVLVVGRDIPERNYETCVKNSNSVARLYLTSLSSIETIQNPHNDASVRI